MAEPEHRPRYDTLIAAAQANPPISVAVVHPCDRNSQEGALEARDLGLIAPIQSELPGPL